MKWSFKIATFQDIQIQVHITFPLIIFYAMYQGSRTFTSGWESAAFGGISVFLLFACVVVHELAHSLQANALGIRVRNITLLPIGGVSQLSSSPKRPADEFRIAVVGPAASLILAALLFGVMLLALRLHWIHDLWHIVRSLQRPSWIGLLVYLIAANFMLGAFNLIPAFPLDGGRVFRSLLSLWLGPTRAIGIASFVGRGLAVVMGLAGIFIGSITLVLVAFFVYAGAAIEHHHFKVHGALSRQCAADVLAPAETLLSPDQSIEEALRLAGHSRQTEFPVIDGQTWVGIVHITDLTKGLKRHSAETPVREVMHREFPIFAPHTDLYTIYRALYEGRARAAAIRHGAEFLGIIGRNDLNRAAELAAAPKKSGARP